MMAWNDKQGVVGNQNLNELLQAWLQSKNQITTTQQHAAMTSFTQTLGLAIQSYYNLSNPMSNQNAYFENLAWNGLRETPAYKNMLLADPQRANLIVAIHESEFNGTAGATMNSSTGAIVIPQPKGKSPCR